MMPIPWIIAFLSGALVLWVEILGARLISPFFGGTLFVWSSVLGVTLFALAIGYALGARLARQYEPDRVLTWSFGLSGAWLALIPVMRRPVLLAAGSLDVGGGALAASAVFFVVPLVFLAMTGPLVVRWRAAVQSEVGREVGNVSALSTVGSVVGALGSAGLLSVLHSVAHGMALAAASAFALGGACAWFGSRRSRAAAAMAALMALSAFAGKLGEPRPKGELREAANSFYGGLRVVDRSDQGVRVLYIDGIPNTVVSLRTLDSTSDYVFSFEFLPLIRPKAKRALLIGLGGGALVGRYKEHYGVDTDVVEIDPVIDRLARKWFGFKPTGDVFIEDGRRYLERDGPKYDLLLYDAFGGDSHPFHLYSLEALQAAKKRLNPGGLVGINLIAYGKGPKSSLARSAFGTLSKVFKNVQAFSANRDLDFNTSYVNITFLASDGPLNFKISPRRARPTLALYWWAIRNNNLNLIPGETITDDYNPVEALGLPAFVEIRRGLLSYDREMLAY